MSEEEEMLFGSERSCGTIFEIESAYQGQQGLELLERGLQTGRPFTMAFVDVRMPPGWDGIVTIQHLWQSDPDLQVVICTAYTDYSWGDITQQLGPSHNLVILKKPFDNIEVLQLAHALTAKRESMEAAQMRLEELESEMMRRIQTERDLAAALEAAEESSRSKRNFLASMGHELRTPLNAIIGYSEMLEEDAQRLGAPDLIPGLLKVRMAGKHLLELINDVLDMSRIESGRMPIQMRPVTVQEVAREAIAMTEPLARKNRNRLEVNLEDGVTWMEVDAMRFRQCLLNLLGNACKFTSDGVVKLEVQRHQDGQQQWLDWRVEDTGIGIAADQMSNLFLPFSQVDAAASRKFGGTGLGLAISQKLCQMMGGQISVESEVGKGSVFTIRVPSMLKV